MALIERDEDLSLLTGLLVSAVAGQGGVAVVSGAVGSGKTELLDTLAGLAADRGLLVLGATGVHAEQSTPLGLLGQLLLRTDLPGVAAGRAVGLLDEGTSQVRTTGARPDPVAAVPVRIMHGLCELLGDVARHTPVLVTVDDAHWADNASLQCLLYLVRRLRPARVLVVFAESEHALRANPLFHTELLREPRCLWAHTARLSPAGVARLTGTDPTGPAAAELYRLTGGNPLLVRALLADQGRGSQTGDGPDASEEEPVVAGDAFGQAVLSCLYRVAPIMRAAARGAAVFDGPVSDVLLGRLLDVEPSVAARAVRELEAAGLLHDGRFRHPIATGAVLDDLSDDERADLHGRAAELLHYEGATATAVARHLIAARRTDPEWALPTLREAAEAARLDNDPELCVRCLELADRACTEETQRARVAMALARVEWQVNPAAGARHLPRLLSALRAGHLRPHHVDTIVRKLLWHGRIGAALDVLSLADRESDAEATARRQANNLWLRTTYPGMVAAVPASVAPVDLAALDPASRGSAILTTVLTRGGDDDTSTAAERVLRESGLDDSRFDSVEAALYALVYGDRVSRAARFCARLADLAAARRAPAWQARLAAVQAEIALRLGDAKAAERHSRSALTYLSLRAWGVAAGALIATLTLALVATGRMDAAAEELARPVPEALFETRFGLLYRYARGRFELASGRPSTALEDLRACGRQMRAWGIDLPAFVPWRGAAAQGYLRVNAPQTARKLVEEQLTRPGADGLRTYGVSLRQLAAVSDVRERPGLLRKAVESLQAAGDRLELAHALADLSRAHQILGESTRARAMACHALKLARECHAEPLTRTLVFRHADAAPDGRRSPARPAENVTSPLSDAERRVAELVSMGHSNREVARSLHITVSTVEQHLTRVYRKLKISGRNDLSMYLGLRGTGPGWLRAVPN